MPSESFKSLDIELLDNRAMFIMSNGEIRLTIPRHSPINALTMGAIAKDAGLTPDDFRGLL
jgi:hypothetical protein